MTTIFLTYAEIVCWPKFMYILIEYAVAIEIGCTPKISV